MPPSGPEPDETLGLIGTVLLRQELGAVSQLVFGFAAVQTDYKWMARYMYYEKLSRRDQLTMDSVMTSNLARSDYTSNFSANGSNFHRAFLHLSHPLRIDELTGFGADKETGTNTSARTSLFAHRGTKQGNIFVDLEIDHTKDRLLTLRAIHLDGRLSDQTDGEKHRGTLILVDVLPFKRKLLKHFPGSGL
jgi:hypothetical protein